MSLLVNASQRGRIEKTSWGLPPRESPFAAGSGDASFKADKLRDAVSSHSVTDLLLIRICVIRAVDCNSNTTHSFVLDPVFQKRSLQTSNLVKTSCLPGGRTNTTVVNTKGRNGNQSVVLRGSIKLNMLTVDCCSKLRRARYPEDHISKQKTRHKKYKIIQRSGAGLRFDSLIALTDQRWRLQQDCSLSRSQTMPMMKLIVLSTPGILSEGFPPLSPPVHLPFTRPPALAINVQS